MSATNVLVQSDRVHLMTDGAIYQPGGLLTAIGPKVRPMPHLSCAVAMRGAYLGWAPIMEEISAAATSFDSLKENHACLLRACAGQYARLLMQCASGPEFEVIVAGISETVGPCAYILSSSDRYGDPWQIIDLSGFVPLPCDEEILAKVQDRIKPGTDPDAIDPINDGLAVMEIQRQQPKLSNGESCFVGGFAQLTTVTTDGVKSGLIHRWPDEIGKRLALRRKWDSYMAPVSRIDPKRLINPTMTASIPMSGQAKGKPAAIVTVITQTPKAMITAEIKNESTVSMMGILRTQPGIGSGT